MVENYFRLLRPYNWIKNFFVFVPLFFARALTNPGALLSTLWAFFAFCLAASAVYIVNDLADVEQDRKHELKKFRPLASGAVSPTGALFLLAILILAQAAVVVKVVPQIQTLLLVYVVLNLFYSFWLKHVAVVDILLVSGFYLLRILVGGAAAHVPISEWLILCTIFIALFLITGKRRAEFLQEQRRQVLEFYSNTVLEGLLIMSATLAVISYSLYTVLVLNSALAVYSVFFVLLGIIRYLLIVHKTNKSEYPERAVLTDPVIVLSGVLWASFMYFIFYWR